MEWDFAHRSESHKSDIEIARREHLYCQMCLNGHFQTLEYLLFQKSLRTAFYCSNSPDTNLPASLTALLQQIPSNINNTKA